MSANHFPYSRYNLQCVTGGLFHQFRTACQRIIFNIYQFLLQLVYLNLLLLTGIAVVDIEDDEYHNQYQQLRLTTEKVGARMSPPRILFSEVRFFFLPSSAFLFTTSSSIFSYFFSAIRNLALLDRGFLSISAWSGTITLLLTRRNGVCRFPKKSVSALPSTFPVFMIFFTMRSSSE